jgi:hypothetical protein
MKKVIIIIFTCLLIFLGNLTVKAEDNSVDGIDIEIYLNKDGSANITEKWQTNFLSGTELYISYGNLDSYNITNFVVKDEDDITYQYQDSWNVYDDFDAKAHKNGINFNGVDTELCWGISEYGDKEYTVSYKISNLVKQYNDSQAIYFTFVPKDMKPSPKYIKIRISANNSLNNNNSQIWAFGYPTGNINFKENYIIMDSNGVLSSNEYMTALIKFNNGMFNASDVVDRSFDSLYEEATSDVNYPDDPTDDDNYNEGSYQESFITIVTTVMIIFGCFYILYKLLTAKSKPIEKFDFGSAGNSIPNLKDVEYWREIPCNGDLLQAYWILNKYGEEVPSTVKEGILGAFLLKWVKEEKVVVTKTKSGLFSFKDNDYAVDLSNYEATDSIDPENLLLIMLKKASGTNKILEVKEFKRWCNKNYDELYSWFSDTIDYETKQLIEKGIITVSYEKNPRYHNKDFDAKVNVVNSSMHEEAVHLLGLKKFLLEFSMMAEREIFEVHIWEEYLILAELMGIADKVAEQLSKLYPHFNEISKINTDITTFAINNMAHIGYETARRSESYHSSSSSFGGFSSGGGGSSFSGGGSSSGGFSSSGGGVR